MTLLQLPPSDHAKAVSLLQTLAFDTTLPPVVRAAFKFQLARQEQNPALYDGEIFSYAGPNTPNLYLELAQLEMKQQKFDDALTNLAKAAANSENSDKSAGADASKLHEDMKTQYTQLLTAAAATDAEEKRPRMV